MIVWAKRRRRRQQQQQTPVGSSRQSPFSALVRNTVRASFRNRTALIFTLGIAVLFMFILGELVGGGGFKAKYGVVDNDQTSASQGFISAMSKIDGATVERGSDSSERDRLQHNQIDIEVIIPQGFAAALAPGKSAHAAVQPLSDSADAQTTNVSLQVLGEVLNRFVETQTGNQPRLSVAAPQQVSGNKVSAVDSILPSMIAYLVLQSGINFVAISLVDMRARKVLKRLRATPITPGQILGAQVVAGAVTVLLQIVFLVGVGLLVFRAHNYGSWLITAVPVLLGTAAFVGIGFLLTSAAKTSESARGLSTLVAFPMMFLSGVFLPISLLPTWMQTAVHVLPLTWLTDALHQVMNDGAGLSSIAIDCLVLAGWAVAMISLATWRFRWD